MMTMDLQRMLTSIASLWVLCVLVCPSLLPSLCLSFPPWLPHLSPSLLLLLLAPSLHLSLVHLIPLLPSFRFFQELNSQLFRTMNDAASSEDHLLTLEMVESVGLDPVSDRLFLTELARLLNFDLNVQRPSDMMDLFFCCC